MTFRSSQKPHGRISSCCTRSRFTMNVQRRVWVKATSEEPKSLRTSFRKRSTTIRVDSGVVEEKMEQVGKGRPDTSTIDVDWSGYEWKQGWLGDENNGKLCIHMTKSSSDPMLMAKSKLHTDVVLADEQQGQYPDDLITLDNFHEPAVVECLQARFKKGSIYTSTGPVLLAVNPFRNLPSLYSSETMEKYWLQSESTDDKEADLLPHVFGLADRTFRSMTRAIELTTGRRYSTVKRNQSILVSGESGAGKTVTTKLLMKYLAALSQRSSKVIRSRAYQREHEAKAIPSEVSETDATHLNGSGSSIEARVLQSNPILESFGNARTIRNDNSSRFGKLIELQFSENGRLVGTKIDVYLLEKVRLITQSPEERNYHIFYEILSGGLSEEVLSSLFLNPSSMASDFKICSSGTNDRRDGVKDVDTFSALVEAMGMMNFSETERNDIFAIVSAILHCSNLTFHEEGDDASLDFKNPHVAPACTLLGVEMEALNEALCYFWIVAEGKSFRRPQTVQGAEKGLAALMKAIYGALFDILVQRVNDEIQFEKTVGSMNDVAASIGVLDIFGFESLADNSFEQLCINYCNESLQQQFNCFMLKNEQKEYVSEGIDWDFIKFPENQDVLALIDDSKGIMSILDDICKTPVASDVSFAQQVYSLCKTRPRFEETPRATGALHFTVQHYAGPVTYSTNGFVEKNRDSLPRETAELLLTSKKPFLHRISHVLGLSTTAASEGKGAAKGGNKTRTVGLHFRQQVKDLRAKIDCTAPHYVRCLKPNGELVPNRFDVAMVAQQLRCGGILQAVGVTRDGFTLHYTHREFVDRYGSLTGGCSRTPDKLDGQARTLADILTAKIHAILEKKTKKVKEVDGALIQIGKSKVLLKHQAFEVLERWLLACQHRSATKINAIHRRFLCRIAYLSVREAFMTKLASLDQTFDEWFLEHRALYYMPRDKTSIAFPDLVRIRKEMFLRRLNKPKKGSRKEIVLENAAWILIEGLWTRNPDFRAEDSRVHNSKRSLLQNRWFEGNQTKET